MMQVTLVGTPNNSHVSCYMQAEHKQREAKMQAQLVALQRRLRGSERRAAMLQQDKSRTATVLQRKDQQLQDSKQALQCLQVCYYTLLYMHAPSHCMGR